MIKVLFVCMGNICRSPTAEGVFNHLVKKQSLDDQVLADSAGTHAYHIGEPPDARAQLTARKRGIDISHLTARRVIVKDFIEFDYILAMDMDNYRHLKAMQSPQSTAQLRLFLEFAKKYSETEVPDPYYGGDNGFERVIDMTEAASIELIKDIRQHLK